MDLEFLKGCWLIDVTVVLEHMQIHLKLVQEFYIEHILWEWKEDFESFTPSIASLLGCVEFRSLSSTAIILLICLALESCGMNKGGVKVPV